MTPQEREQDLMQDLERAVHGWELNVAYCLDYWKKQDPAQWQERMAAVQERIRLEQRAIAQMYRRWGLKRSWEK